MLRLRFATKKDEGRIVSFLRENWHGNPILMDSPTIFGYQYMRRADCGFVLAEDEESGKLYGIKGFLPVNGEESPDVTACLAIALQGARPMLNMEMQRFLEKNTHCRMMWSLGLNPNTAARVYPFFHYTVGAMQQYYRLAPRESYRIAAIKRPLYPPAEGGLLLEPYADMETLLAHFSPAEHRENLPYKDADYIRYRYFEHPVYRYRVCGAAETPGGKAVALVVARVLETQGAAAYRIVDFLGRRESFARLGQAIDGELSALSCEYADFFCFGMPEEALLRAGFVLRGREDGGENVIPNYFEPFVRENKEILFFCNLKESFLLCKADGDQDRPSVLPPDFRETRRRA